MGCGASTAAPAASKYAAADDAPVPAKGAAPHATPQAAVGKSAYLEAIKARSAIKQKFDCVLSYEAGFLPGLYSVVEAELGKSYTIGPRSLASVAEASRVIIFLSPTYFGDATCCAEFCEVVKAGVEVLLVCVDGSEWAGQPFPALTDVPESVTAADGSTVLPREAASIIFGHTIAIEHKQSYLAAFIEKVRQRLGPPASANAGIKKAEAAPTNREIRYDAFLSHKRSEAQDTVARLHDKLSDLGYRAFIDRNDLVELPSLKLAVRDTATFVAFLTPGYFASPWCCLELCQAVEHGVAITFVLMDGGVLPDAASVPESVVVHDEEDVTVRPREAYSKVRDTCGSIALDKLFFSAFVEGLQDTLGPPPAVAALEGEAKDIWKAAGGGTTLSWAKVKAQLAKKGGGGYATAEPTLARALGVRESAAPADATVSAVAFAALFAGGAKFREVVDALSAGASAKASAEERLVKVSILPEGGGEAAAAADGGLVLVGPTTSLEDVRAQLRSRFEEESADDPLLSTGRFTFLSSGRPVRRKQEKLVRGKHVGEPVTIQPDKNAKLSLKDAADDIKESAAEAAKAKAAKAAQELIAAGARREATMLDLDEVMRHNLRSASLRRHAAAAAAEGVADAAEAKARRAAAEKDAQIAILCLTLNDALVANDVAKSLRIAEQLRGFAKAGAGSTEGLAADAPPAAIADAMRPREMDARAALSPALERMRAEMFAASSGGALKGSGAQAADAKDLKRVVILGGGPCGASILHQLVHIHAGFHVTVVDTKEYYEDTPCVLRMMVGNDVDHIWHNLNINFGDIIRGKPHAEYICGTAAAVRKDHVLVGTTNGVASRVVPYDYLVLATGSHYQSDIKTEGASIAHRYESFAMERERMKEVSSFAVIGAGLVGIQLACELRHYFPDKEVNVYTRAGGWLPRVPGAHDNVLEEIDRQGINLVKGKEIVSTDEEGRMVTREGEKIGPPGARTYWCTGYKPNNSYLLDTRTDPDIASELDEWGFVKVSPANRMSEAKGLGHIYAGGDLATKAVHNHGERTAAGAWMHAGAIVENILLASGKREGAPKMAAINFFAGTDLEVSLGPKAGLLYATNPGFESFFHDPTKLKEKYGELAAAGRSGWQEFQAGTINDMGCVNWMMFNMIPEGAANMYTKDDMTIWGMFVTPALLDIPPPAAE